MWRYGQTCRVELSLKYKIGRWIMSRFVTVTLIYHRHKPIDLIRIYYSLNRNTFLKKKMGWKIKISNNEEKYNL
jgi:hypothetical protein